jgi:hypothetical protein
MGMTRYTLETATKAADGEYWMRTSAASRWVPCWVRSEQVGMEIRMTFTGLRWGMLTYWPEDPTCGDLEPGMYLELLGPIPQPET